MFILSDEEKTSKFFQLVKQLGKSSTIVDKIFRIVVNCCLENYKHGNFLKFIQRSIFYQRKKAIYKIDFLLLQNIQLVIFLDGVLDLLFCILEKFPKENVCAASLNDIVKFVFGFNYNNQLNTKKYNIYQQYLLDLIA